MVLSNWVAAAGEAIGFVLRFLAAIVLAVHCGGAVAGLPETIEKVKPSIVAVGTVQKTRSPQFAFRGTGFVVGDGTLVATNAHVLPTLVEQDKGEALVIVAAPGGKDPQPREARAVAIDKDHDLALLRISGAPLPALKLRDPAGVREGESFAFSGFPIGSVLGFAPVTHRAVIAAVTPIAIPGGSAGELNEKVIRRLKSGAFSVFQLDATAYPGNSGSPLYDIDSGEVVGIINMVMVKGTKEAALSQPSGISFAVPTRYLEELLKKER